MNLTFLYVLGVPAGVTQKEDKTQHLFLWRGKGFVRGPADVR